MIDILTEDELTKQIEALPDKDKILLALLQDYTQHKEHIKKYPELDDTKEIELIKNEYSDYIFPLISTAGTSDELLENFIAGLIFEYSNSKNSRKDCGYLNARKGIKPTEYNKQLNKKLSKIKIFTENNPNSEKIQELLNEIEIETKKGLELHKKAMKIPYLDTKENIESVLRNVLKYFNIQKKDYHIKELIKAL